MSLTKTRSRAIKNIYNRTLFGPVFRFGYDLACQYEDPENHLLSTAIRFGELPRDVRKTLMRGYFKRIREK